MSTCPHYLAVPYHHNSFTGAAATLCQRRMNMWSGALLSCVWYVSDYEHCPVWRAAQEAVRCAG